MFRACGDQIYPGGFDGTVSQHIRQFRHIPARVIKAAGKQMAEIMWKDLRICNSGAGAEPLHLHPNLFPRHALSASGEKNLARSYFLPVRILLQLPAQLSRNQNRPDLALEKNLRFSGLNRLESDISHLTDPDARRADGLKQQ